MTRAHRTCSAASFEADFSGWSAKTVMANKLSILIQKFSVLLIWKGLSYAANWVFICIFFPPLKHMDAYIFSSWLSSCSAFILGCFYFNWMEVNVRAKAWLASNAESAQMHFIHYTSAPVHPIFPPSGGVDLHSDLVDIWRGYGLRPPGGGLWQLHEGVPQEAGVPAQHPHLHAGWSAHAGRPAEGHDHLHHRRPRKGRGGQDDWPEGKKAGRSPRSPALGSTPTSFGSNPFISFWDRRVFWSVQGLSFQHFFYGHCEDIASCNLVLLFFSHCNMISVFAKGNKKVSSVVGTWVVGTQIKQGVFASSPHEILSLRHFFIPCNVTMFVLLWQVALKNPLPY